MQPAPETRRRTSRPGNPVMACHDLTVRYGRFTAVHDVTISVEPGEIFGLLGPNGAGKTSVIRALTTIVPPAGGRATIDGHDLDDRVAVRSSIGVLPESNGYPGTQTARGYLRFHGQLFGLDAAEADRRAEQLLDQLGLGAETRRIATFSRGMRQRLGLCRAMINDPAVLFLDEPTLGLDPAGQEEILAHFARRAVENRTAVILCSHLLDDVERVCDRVGILHEGRIVAAGTVEEVIAASAVRRTARITVAPDDLHAAARALEATSAGQTLAFDNGRPGEMTIELTALDGERSTLLRALLDADVEPRGFDLQGARLSDAFFAVTGAKREVLR